MVLTNMPGGASISNQAATMFGVSDVAKSGNGALRGAAADAAGAAAGWSSAGAVGGTRGLVEPKGLTLNAGASVGALAEAAELLRGTNPVSAATPTLIFGNGRFNIGERYPQINPIRPNDFYTPTRLPTLSGLGVNANFGTPAATFAGQTAQIGSPVAWRAIGAAMEAAGQGFVLQ